MGVSLYGVSRKSAKFKFWNKKPCLIIDCLNSDDLNFNILNAGTMRIQNFISFLFFKVRELSLVVKPIQYMGLKQWSYPLGHIPAHVIKRSYGDIS